MMFDKDFSPLWDQWTKASPNLIYVVCANWLKHYTRNIYGCFDVGGGGIVDAAATIVFSLSLDFESNITSDWLNHSGPKL